MKKVHIILILSIVILVAAGAGGMLLVTETKPKNLLPVGEFSAETAQQTSTLKITELALPEGEVERRFEASLLVTSESGCTADFIGQGTLAENKQIVFHSTMALGCMLTVAPLNGGKQVNVSTQGAPCAELSGAQCGLEGVFSRKQKPL